LAINAAYPDDALSLMNKLVLRLAAYTLAASYILHAMLLISWMASTTDEGGRVYFMNHGFRIYLPLPPLNTSVWLWLLMFVVLIGQMAGLFMIVRKSNRVR
jgi:hypothetical protein